MLTLYVFGPFFGLPDASPFCIKGLILMKMSGQAHSIEAMSFRKAPKGKAPYLSDGSTTVADSHFILRHLEHAHGADFSGGYSKEELAKAWAVVRMLEEHFYFLSMHYRWLEDANFWKGPYQFFAAVPSIFRPLIARIVRNKVRKTQHLQGLGRHNADERFILAKGDVDAVETLLGEKKYILGDHPCGADASVAAFLWTASTPYFDSPLGEYIRSQPRLMAFLKRMAVAYFPDFQFL